MYGEELRTVNNISSGRGTHTPCNQVWCLGVSSLIKACIDLFVAHLDEENAIRVAILSSLYLLTKYPLNLKRRAMDAIVASRRPLKSMTGWEDLNKIHDLKIEIFDYKADN